MFFQIKDMNVYYGVIHAIKDINLEVNEGEIVTLIGSNGAGKTTTLQAISGIIPTESGCISFLDKDITKQSPTKIVSYGISQVPEGRRVFTDMTILENLEMGAYLRKDKENLKSDYNMIYERFPILEKRKYQLAGTLSGGEQQMLAMGRALMAKPKMLLLDEPSMGLSPIYVKQIFDIIQDINKKGTTILLVEQNAHMALSIASRGYVLENGEIKLKGNSVDLLLDNAVKEAYLGG